MECLQYAYCENPSTDDAVALAMHSVLLHTWLRQSTYRRSLFSSMLLPLTLAIILTKIKDLELYHLSVVKCWPFWWARHKWWKLLALHCPLNTEFLQKCFHTSTPIPPLIPVHSRFSCQAQLYILSRVKEAPPPSSDWSWLNLIERGPVWVGFYSNQTEIRLNSTCLISHSWLLIGYLVWHLLGWVAFWIIFVTSGIQRYSIIRVMRQLQPLHHIQ